MVFTPETRARVRKRFMQNLYPTEHLAIASLGKLKTGLPVLRLLEEPFVENQIGHAAAVNFMNHLRPNWASPSDEDHEILVFSAELNGILMVKDEEGRGIYQSDDMIVLLDILFKSFEFPYKGMQSKKNQYIMRCVMRVLCVSEISIEVCSCASSILALTLERIFICPNDPIVNHYLFESIALLIKRTCYKQISLSNLRSHIMHKIKYIIFNGRTELLAYAYQIVFLFVECNITTVNRVYYALFERILSPVVWYVPENLPGYVYLLQGFIQKLPQEIKKNDRLHKLVAIFDILVASSTDAQQAFYVLNTVIDSLKYDDIRVYMPHIWNVLFMRLKENCTSKFVKSVLISMSLFLVKHGSAKLVDTVNGFSEKSDVFLAILEQFWIPKLKLITGALEVKLTAVASTRLMSESPALLNAMAINLWGKMLESNIILLSQPEEDRVEEEQETQDIAQNMDRILYYARKKEEDPLMDINDPKKFLLTSVLEIQDKHPKMYSQIIEKHLYPPNQGLHQLLNILQYP